MFHYHPGCHPREPGFGRDFLVCSVAGVTPLPDKSGIDPCPMPWASDSVIRYKQRLSFWKHRQSLYEETPACEWQNIRLTGRKANPIVLPPPKNEIEHFEWNGFKDVLMPLATLVLLSIIAGSIEYKIYRSGV